MGSARGREPFRDAVAEFDDLCPSPSTPPAGAESTTECNVVIRLFCHLYHLLHSYTYLSNNLSQTQRGVLGQPLVVVYSPYTKNPRGALLLLLTGYQHNWNSQ